MQRNKGNSISSSMIYKTMERYVVMAFQMIVQIVIARILEPSDYGIVSMMMVFIAIATIFIQNGFNMALVQKKDADETDFSTALMVNVAIGIFMYAVIALSSPAIARFYNQPFIDKCLPVMSLLLVFGSVNSIQIAIANRKMMFGQLFMCSVVSSFVSGVLGIVCALFGLGVWALVIQQLSSSVALSIMLLFQQHWVPNWTFRKDSAKSLFSFGWKLLAAGLLNQIYNELNSLVIGKRYTSSDLAYYTKGNQFPKYLTMGVDSSISSVMFAAFSKNQADRKSLHSLMKKTIIVNSYLIIPLLALMAMVAHPLVTVLLTDKWQPLVPFLRICCITCALHPLASTQVQAIAAVGRSDVRLKIEIVKKGIGIGLLVLAVPYGPMVIAISAAIAGIIGVIIGAVACSIITSYPFKNLATDNLPVLITTIISMAPLYFIGKLNLNPVLLISIDCIVGLGFYLFISAIFNLYGFQYMKKYVKNIFSNNK